MGLRLVKKTVNQDNPTVYHLFFADEKGSAGSDLTFFEFPGVPRGRAGAGDVHRIVWRVASETSLDFWEERLAANGVESERDGESLRLRRPRGARARAARRRRRRRAADRRPPGGPRRARPAGLPRGPRLQRRPRREQALLEALEFEPVGRAAGRRAETEPRRPLPLRRAAGRAARCRAPAASTTSPGRRRSTSTRSGASGRSPAALSRPR